MAQVQGHRRPTFTGITLSVNRIFDEASSKFGDIIGRYGFMGPILLTRKISLPLNHLEPFIAGHPVHNFYDNI